jgi:endonuclease/exonuclease/phosphatase family metal-dependent hydrolase
MLVGVSRCIAQSEITIASFNLRVFGVTKADKPPVMDELASIIRRFDLVALQEIRDASGTAIEKLLVKVNDGSQEDYQMIVGPRLGRTSSKEQYAFFFRTSSIKPLATPFTWLDESDSFEREPLLTIFSTTAGSFDFILANIHTKPEDARNEISLLPKVLQDGKAYFQESDILCLGDWNADGSYFNEDTYQELFPGKDYLWIIPNSADTTIAAKSNTYDRMAASISMQEDFSGSWGVLRFDEDSGFLEKGLKPTDISDHYPVWATFYSDKDSD